MKNWFYKLSRGKQIALIVLMVHACFVLFLCGDYWISKAPTKRRKVAVNMVRIEPPKMHAPVTNQAPPAANKAQPKPIATKKQPTPPTQTPKAVKPQAVAKNPPKAPEPNHAVQASLLQEIEASMEAITSAAPSVTPKTVMHIPTLTEVAREPISEGSTDEELAAFLQQTLTLPEFGEVRVFLAINKLGQLQTLDILSSKSEKNATFLKNRLPELQFPCLNEGASLTVVFSNAL